MALFAVVVALLFVVLNWYVGPEKPGERKDLVLALAQILGGAALLSGGYFTWRTLQVNREGQITERFTRAIDQLGATGDDGNKRIEIRLGGIYALDRIARDSERDAGPIMEILTAYVRNHAPWRPGEGQQGREEGTVETKSGDDSWEEPATTEVPALAPDIQAIIGLLHRRTQWEYKSLDLHETNLSGADLWAVKLWGSNLSGACLRRANLKNADLGGVHLKRADLRGANLEGADLRGANLKGADLRGADLSEVRTLTQAQINDGLVEEHTRLPSYLKRPAHWGVKTDEQPEGD